MAFGLKLLFGKSKEDASVTVSETVGVSTGSMQNDFYVYEWYIKETGEIFYVGKGRGNRYKEYHERAYEAEKIRSLYDTDNRFVKTGLTEDEALVVETQEMLRVLNETDYVLANRIVPLSARRGNAYSRSQSCELLEFEKAPQLFACEIEEHYFGVQHRSFDVVDLENLSHPYFINKNIDQRIIEHVYGGEYEKYYHDVLVMLEKRESKIVSTRYAKSVSAWIYAGDDYVSNYEINEKNAHDRIGKYVPVYHLIDVWKALKDVQEELLNDDVCAPLEIKPIHSRIPLTEIPVVDDESAVFDTLMSLWEQGDRARIDGNYEKAICLLDEARARGYSYPALYKSYAKLYRKLKDIENEIDILNEAVLRYENEYPRVCLSFEEERRKAVERLNKQRK